MRLAVWFAAVCAQLTPVAAPTNAERRRAESPNFILHADAPEARPRDRVLQLEDHHQLLSSVTGVEAPPGRNKRRNARTLP